MAKRAEEISPEIFKYYPIAWNKFPDGTDNITVITIIIRPVFYCYFLAVIALYNTIAYDFVNIIRLVGLFQRIM